MKARRLSYANVVATLALFLALGGGTAWATHRWLLSSTKQIKPSVLKKLHGAKGPTGATGGTGATGSTGSNLTAETTLPAGASESGSFAASAAYPTNLFAAIHYAQPLATPIALGNVIWVPLVGGGGGVPGSTANCPGQGQAARGYLCVYDLEDEEDTWVGEPADYRFLPSPDPGAIVFWDATSGATDAYALGTWTVTAP